MTLRRMRDVPMLAIDRERMQQEFEGFDDMTIEQFHQVARERVDSLRDLILILTENKDD